MQIVAEYNGVTYIGKNEPDDAAQFASMLYKNLPAMECLKFELLEGGFVVFGPDVLRAMVIKVLP